MKEFRLQIQSLPYMQFHVLQHDVILHDWMANRQAIAKQIEEALPKEGDFVLLSEMTDTGWSMELDKITGIGTVGWACSLAKQHHIWIQVGWADQIEGRGRNCVTICSPAGSQVATYTKVFTCNPLKEHEYFDTGNELVVVDLGNEASVVCPSICYDVRFPELWRPATLAGANIFTVSSSWPQSRIAHWRALLVARAIENQAFVIASNRIGKDATTTWGGSSMIISPQGEILGQATETDTQTISVDVDLSQALTWREAFSVMKDIRSDLIGKIKVRKITA